MIDGKPILAIESSEKRCSVSLFVTSDNLFEFSLIQKNTHSEKIFELIDKVFLISGYGVSDIGCIAVSSGPGSFTGLRIGMSAAKGIAFGSSLPIVPVPTFEAMALELSDILPDNTRFAIANKVNADEIYFAAFQIKDNNYIFVKELSIISKSELKSENDVFISYGNAVNDSKNSLFSAPSAKYVAKWCEKFGKDLLTFEYDFLEPNYLKDFIIKGARK